MPETKIIDGKAIAVRIRAGIRDNLAIPEFMGIQPGLALLLVGSDVHSASYVNSKSRLARECGINVVLHHLTEHATEPELLSLINRLNGDPAIHGILLQLPLPSGLDQNLLLQAIDPDKDVDGLHPLNSVVKPCTPAGCMELIASVMPDLRGCHAVVLGRSRLVGAPMAQLLLNAGATVTILHSQSKNHAEICRQADILVSATGKPRLVRGSWIKPGAVVIDVGLTWQDNSLIGDVAFEEASGIAGAITPVPGGTGPMTLAMLLSNTVKLWEKSL